MAVLDMVAELTGSLPGLSPLLAEKHIARAWKDIQNERRWSFLKVDGIVVCPVMQTSGSFSITQFQSQVVADATASTTLTPFIGGVPDLTQMQIRFGGPNTLQSPQIYRIMAVDQTNPAAIVLTLDRLVAEPTNATATYQSYRCYITPPQDNFLAWDEIVDMTTAWKMSLNYTSGYFDAFDPQRMQLGEARYCGFFRTAGPYGNSNTPDPNQNQGAPIYELWPAPTSGRTFYVRFNQRGWDLSSPTSTQPSGIDDQVILTRAYGWYAYQFAQANAPNFPTFKNVNWQTLIQTARAEYKELLIAAKRNDDANALSTVWNRGHWLRSGGFGWGDPYASGYLVAQAAWRPY